MSTTESCAGCVRNRVVSGYQNDNSSEDDSGPSHGYKLRLFRSEHRGRAPIAQAASGAAQHRRGRFAPRAGGAP